MTPRSTTEVDVTSREEETFGKRERELGDLNRRCRDGRPFVGTRLEGVDLNDL